MTKFRSIRIALCLMLSLSFAATVSAQETTGSISGTVTDASGAAVKGATFVNPSDMRVYLKWVSESSSSRKA